MARTHENPWERLDDGPDGNSLRVDAEHPVDLFWTIDPAGAYAFAAYDIPWRDGVRISSPAGVDIRFCKTHSGSGLLFFSLKNNRDWEMFRALCLDICVATKGRSNAAFLDTALKRVAKWKRFLSKNRDLMLSKHEIQGLVGELLFLRDHLAQVFSTAEAISFWQGPHGAPQDFTVVKDAVEVKSVLASARSEVTISSFSQLESKAEHLYLHVYRLGEATADSVSALTLPGLVASILSMCAGDESAADAFESALAELGYVALPAYDDYVYVKIGEETYEVRDGFPRIQPCDVSHGVIEGKYRIALNWCRDFLAKPKWMRRG